MPKICFAIVLNEWTNKQYEYEIRFNNLKHYLEIRFNSSMSGSNDEDDENLDVHLKIQVMDCLFTIRINFK